MPSFWLYVLLILLFSVTLKWLPISGYEKAINWVLPIGGGVLGSLAGTIRLTKTEVLDVFRENMCLQPMQRACRTKPLWSSTLCATPSYL